MASIATDKTKDGKTTRRLLINNPAGDRKTIRLGAMPIKAANALKLRCESLVSHAVAGIAWEPDLAAWVRDLPAEMADKLATAGLIAPRQSTRLGAYVDRFIASRGDVKVATRAKYYSARKQLLDYFGPDRELSTITRGDADAYRRHLADGRKENTVRKHMAVCKLWFNTAVRQELLTRSPFEDQKASILANREKMVFVTREDIAKVVDVCPSTEWKLIIGLARYCGLRCPTEILALKWSDVLWDKRRLVVTSSKTEHHVGKGHRVIPMLDGIRPLLDAAYDEAAEGAEYVITKYRDTNQNLRQQFTRLILRAGLKPWPKLFQNLRSSLATELSGKVPQQAAVEWLGHSAEVAQKHYQQVLDEHYEQAMNLFGEGGVKAAQKAAQHMATPAGTAGNESLETQSNFPDMPLDAIRRKSLQHKDYGRSGTRTPTP